jgi:hypothetical protein
MSRNDFDRFAADGTDGLLRTTYLIVGDLQEACNGGPHGGGPGGG